MLFIRVLLVVLIGAVGCSKNKGGKSSPFPWETKNPPELGAQPYVMDSEPILIKNVRIMTGHGETIEVGNIYTDKGIIKGVSASDIIVPENAKIIDGNGLTVTPGIIDVHSHIGVFNSPALSTNMDFNEHNRPFTSDVWAEHGFYPQDPMLWRALASGVTTFQVLHGSSNLIGGRSFVAKLIPKTGARQMRFFGAKQGVKLACGENVKRGGPAEGKFGVSRMGNMAGWRQTFQKAIEYKREWDNYDPTNKAVPMPKRDFTLETLVKVLADEILVHWHCYRADDINNILDVAKEFGFKIRTVHHALEAYKLRKRLAQEEVAVATWTDWWGFKQEAYDGVPQNAALLADAGARPIIHSDSELDIRYLLIEAGKAMMAGRKIGIQITPEEALKWVTLNPAWAIGLDDKIGSIENGKMADLVIWDSDPFSIYAKTKFVLINGKIVFDRDQQIRPTSDFEIGTVSGDLNDGRDFAAPPIKQVLSFAKDQNLDAYPEEFILTNVKVFDGKNILTESQNLKFEKQLASLLSTSDVEKSSLPKIDGTGKFITPGLIESSTNLGLAEIGSSAESRDDYGDYMRPTADHFAADALDLDNIRIAIAREEGITTAIAHPGGKLIGGYAVSFDLNPDSPNINSQAALSSFLEKSGSDSHSSDGGSDSRSMIWRNLRAIISDTQLFISGTNPYSNGQSSPFQLTRRDLVALQPTIKGSVPWMMTLYRASHIDSLLQMNKNLRLSIKPIIMEGQEAWKVANKLAATKIPVVLRPSNQTPSVLAMTHSRYDQAAYLNSKGVDVIISTNDSMLQNRIRQEAGVAVKYGLPYIEALKAITSKPAEVFSLKNKGSLDSGDIVIWSGDPLEPTSVVEHLRIGGQAMPLENRQKALARKYLNYTE